MSTIFIFSPDDSPSKTMKNYFLVHLKTSFHFQYIQIFAFPSSSFFCSVGHCFRGWLSFFKKLHIDKSKRSVPFLILYDFSRMFHMLYSINRLNLFSSWDFGQYDNMCIAIICFPGCDVINFEINLSFLIKTFSYMTKKLRTKI